MRYSIALMALAVAMSGCSKSSERSGEKSNEAKSAAPPAQEAEPDPPPEPPASPLSWHTDEKEAFARAQTERKPLLIDFGAEWCLPCKEYERRTFTDPAVIERLSAMVLLRFDVSAQTAADEVLQKRYKAQMLPTLIALTPDGDEQARITEFLEPEPFLSALSKLD